MISLNSGIGNFVYLHNKKYSYFAGNNYLGLANHPVVKAASIQSIKMYGVNFSALRCTTGTVDIHFELEKQLSILKEKQDVVVSQDTMGRYESEGIFDALQPEALDGYDTQQWVGEQPWCNGKIGTYGGSYVGFTQWIPAPLQSPFLVTMIPYLTFSDFHDVAYQDGAFRLGLFGPWSFEMSKPYTASSDSIDKVTVKILMTLPLIDQDKILGWKIPFLRDWLLHQEHDRYWDRTSIGDGSSKIKASVYNIGGWYDVFLKGTINNYIKMIDPMIDPEIRKKQKLLIGHGYMVI